MDRAAKSKVVAKDELKVAAKPKTVAPKTATKTATKTAAVKPATKASTAKAPAAKAEAGTPEQKKAPAAKAQAGTVEHKKAPNKSSEKSGSITDYWTPERMRAATLHPALRPRRKGKKAAPKAKGKGAPEVTLKIAKPAQPTRRVARAAADTTYDTTPVADVRAFPASTIGKIYMTSGGNDYYATGFVVGRRTVFTVASVLYNRESGQWPTNVVFYPEYNYGPGAGLGAFSIDEMWVAANWVEAGGLLNDFGALITTVPIQDFTGSVGLMANAPINQGQYLVLGYPGNPVPGYPFDGERMWQSVSAYMGDVAWIIQAGGNMTYGAHGAPWLIFREGGWYANGIFAVQVVDPDSMLSPYFGNELWAFYSHLKKLGYT